MKYSEAKKEIEALSSKYNAYKDKYTDYFNVFYKNEEVAYLKTDKRYSVTVWSENNFTKLPFSNKLFMIMSELAMTPLDKRVEEKKYQVKVFGEYLNVPIGNVRPFLFDEDDTENTKTCFTLYEIEQLKQREDIPLNWEKVKLEDAK
ncbi:hypothetical protein LVP1_g083 [Lactobacillus phage P1]|uniref:Uncharacterized protein n=1 Tax=Lactobacillus phage P1 TaxID=1846168 RepID=A0A1S5RCW9_9CAUD|nr:hypothetical protein HOR15_gp06 [Lactobacillus phage P1]ANO58012.1 hypothetical protein LVP1_g083 [Lactobacillus phage P1]APU93367.1 hypothetical protein LVP2_g093 [Lactobacillus phage P2]